MAKAFECDRCKKLVKSAITEDLFYPNNFRIEIQYRKVGSRWDDGGKRKTDWIETDICYDCRFALMKEIIRGLEAKAKYSWSDLKNPKVAAEVFGSKGKAHTD